MCPYCNIVENPDAPHLCMCASELRQKELEKEARRADRKRGRVFFFHYNKPASKAAGVSQISVHYAGTCYLVENVDIRVPCKGHHNKRQPYFVMKGRGVVRIENYPDVEGANGRSYNVAIIEKS